MGLYPQVPIHEYWNTEEGPGEWKAVSGAIGLKRWEQIERYFQLPGVQEVQEQRYQPPQEVPVIFQKLWVLSTYLMGRFQAFWILGKHLAVDEAMARFQGRSHEKVTLPNKPTPEGFKIWVLADFGYVLTWLWHQKGSPKGGPVGLDGSYKHLSKSQ